MIIFGKTHRIYHEVLSHPGGKVKNPTVEGWTGGLAGGPESHRCLGLEWYVVLNEIYFYMIVMSPRFYSVLNP